jgi:hypothetical protein
MYLYEVYDKDGIRLSFGLEDELKNAIFRAKQGAKFHTASRQPTSIKVWKAIEIDISKEAVEE